MVQFSGSTSIRLVPTAKVVALSSHRDTDQRSIRRMFQAGASGYLLKTSSFSELCRALHQVRQSQLYISPNLGRVSDFRLGCPPDTRGSDSQVLTPRECDVLRLSAEGKRVKEIAAVLYVSPKTVESHRSNIMKKLGLYSIAQLTKYAVREGLMTCPQERVHSLS